jgi:hypothetical protein
MIYQVCKGLELLTLYCLVIGFAMEIEYNLSYTLSRKRGMTTYNKFLNSSQLSFSQLLDEQSNCHSYSHNSCQVK